MTTLNLELRGLCGLVPNEFVPEEPEMDSFPVNRLRVLVLDAATLGARNELSLCPHTPRITVGRGSNAQTFELDRHKITFEGLTLGQRVRLQPDFWEVARMNQVTRAPFNVADGFFLDPPQSEGLVASLRLTTGEARGIDLSPHELDFQNGTPSYRKRFARAIHLLLRLGGPGKIHFTRFGETDPEHSIDLVPDNTNSVNVTLTNLCDPTPSAEGFEDESVDSAVDAKGLARESADFATFYGLLPTYRGPLFVPVDPASPRARRQAQSPAIISRGEVRAEAVGSDTGCVPAVFNNHPDA